MLAGCTLLPAAPLPARLPACLPAASTHPRTHPPAYNPTHKTVQYLQGQALYPAICLKNAELAINFGADLAAAPFKHAPPPGYVGLASAPRSATASWQDALSAAGSSPDRKPLALILEPAR